MIAAEERIADASKGDKGLSRLLRRELTRHGRTTGPVRSQVDRPAACVGPLVQKIEKVEQSRQLSADTQSGHDCDRRIEGRDFHDSSQVDLWINQDKNRVGARMFPRSRRKCRMLVQCLYGARH